MKYISLSIPGYNKISPPKDLERISSMNDPLGSLLSFGITLLLITAALLSVIFLILGGIGWITSGGDKEGLEKAKKKITFAIIGLVVSLFAFFIINIVGQLLGVSLLSVKGRPDIRFCAQTNCNGVNCDTVGKTCKTVIDPLEGHDSCACK